MKTKKILNFLLVVFLVMTACATPNNGANNPPPRTSVGGTTSTTGSSSSTGNSGSSNSVTSPGAQVSSPVSSNENEPNDNINTAMKVSPNFGVTVNGTIGDKDNADFFEISIPGGSNDGILKTITNESNNNWTPVLLLYNGEKNDIGNSTAET